MIPGALAAVLAAGVLLRVGLILAVAPGFDAGDLVRVGDLLQARGLHLYAGLGGFTLYPYPPGWLPWPLAVDALAPLLGAARVDLVRLPPILAECLLAVLVHRRLLETGRDGRTALLAAALVALGPAFILPSAVVGQFDSVVMLLVVSAIACWPRRSGIAGAWLGGAIALKAYPVIFVAALAATARGRRPAVNLIAAAVAVPLLLTLPFLIAEPAATLGAAGYAPLPGVSGLSLVLQPDLVAGWVANRPLELSALSRWVQDSGVPRIGAFLSVALACVFVRRHRPPPLDAALLVVLAFWVGCVNLYWQYLVWGLPLLLLAGRIRSALVLQMVALPGLLLVIVARTQHWLDDGPAWATATASASGMGVFWVMVALLVREGAHMRRPPANRSPSGSEVAPAWAELDERASRV